MKTLVNHPNMWLDDGAADSLARWEARYGVIGLSDAGRSEAEQLELIRRWNEGGPANRPPYLFKPGWPSPHQSGLALDTPEHGRFESTCGPYGWRFNIDSDPVHAIYEADRDTTRGQATPAAPGVNPDASTTIGEENIMRLVANNENPTTGYLVTELGFTAVSAEEYQLFFRLITSDQTRTPFLAASRPFTPVGKEGWPHQFTTAECVTMDAAIERCGAGLVEAIARKLGK